MDWARIFTSILCIALVVWILLGLRNFLLSFIRWLRKELAAGWRHLVDKITFVTLAMIVLGYVLSRFGCRHGGEGGQGGQGGAGIERPSRFQPGQIAISAPDTIAFGNTGTIRVRITGSTIPRAVLIEKIDLDTVTYKERFSIDTISIDSIMDVNVSEIGASILTVERGNKNERQIIDTNRFSEWSYFLTPVDCGITSVKISASIATVPYDIPVYKRTITIVATRKEQARLIVRHHYVVLSLGGILMFVLLFRLIPTTIILEDMTKPTKRTNFWAAGSLGLVIYLITIASLVVFSLLEINMAYVGLAFTGTILLFVTFTAASLRASGKLSEKSFLQLVGMTLKRVPPLNLILSSKSGDSSSE